MINKSFIASALAFVISTIAFFGVWQYQQRAKDWPAVSFQTVSADIAYGREKRYGKIWTAQVNYRFDGKPYTKRVTNLPLGCEQIFVNPEDPTDIVGHNGPTFYALFVPGLGMALSILFAGILIMIKISPES